MKRSLFSLILAIAFLLALSSCASLPLPGGETTDPISITPYESDPIGSDDPTTENPVTGDPGTNPSQTNPGDTNPPVTNPIDTNPPVTNPIDTNPPVTNPIDTNPPVTNPIDTNPPVTNPIDTNPPVTNPIDTNPPVTNPIDTNPPVTNPIDTNPPVTNPIDTNPPVTNPPVTNPIDTVPPVTEPPKLVAFITITGANRVTVGNTLRLSASHEPADPDVPGIEWSIESGERLANISKDGILSAKAPGTVVVKASAIDESGIYATHTVTVLPLVSMITIQNPGTIQIGDRVTLKATVLPDEAENKQVKWEIVSGKELATITDGGVMTANAPGTVIVHATSTDGSDVVGALTVKITAPVKKITVSGPTSVYVGASITLTADILPENADNKEIDWSITSGKGNANLSQDGVLSGIQPGSVTLRATAKDGSGVYASFTVTVKEAPLLEGQGTKTSPFLIRTLDDLKKLPRFLGKSGYYFLQVADIDCASVGEWIVIGDDDHPFRHHYDGGDHTISNLCLDGDAAALISFAEDATFKNIRIVNAHTKDNSYYVEGSTRLQSGNEGVTAALVGDAVGCSFVSCSATIDFKSSNEGTGGLVGSVLLKKGQPDLMTDCHVTGSMSGSGSSGGLIAYIQRHYKGEEFAPSEPPVVGVRHCSTDVTITSFVSSRDIRTIGGLIGNANLVAVEDCCAKGNISVIDGNIGGLIGETYYDLSIRRSYATGDILCTSDDHYGGVSAGGLMGYARGTCVVVDCYATGDITAPDVEFSPCQDDSSRNGGPFLRYYNPCGSLIGTLVAAGNYTDHTKFEVHHCYATGTVNVPHISEDERVYCHGALVGLVCDNYTRRYMKNPGQLDQSDWAGFEDTCILYFGDNYNLEPLRTYFVPLNNYQGSGLYGMTRPYYSAMPKHEYVSIITPDQLGDESTFVGWNFDTVWEMTENGPQLRTAP